MQHAVGLSTADGVALAASEVAYFTGPALRRSRRFIRFQLFP
jgi:hypothetical protein